MSVQGTKPFTDLLDKLKKADPKEATIKDDLSKKKLTTEDKKAFEDLNKANEAFQSLCTVYEEFINEYNENVQSEKTVKAFESFLNKYQECIINQNKKIKAINNFNLLPLRSIIVRKYAEISKMYDTLSKGIDNPLLGKLNEVNEIIKREERLAKENKKIENFVAAKKDLINTETSYINNLKNIGHRKEDILNNLNPEEKNQKENIEKLLNSISDIKEKNSKLKEACVEFDKATQEAIQPYTFNESDTSFDWLDQSIQISDKVKNITKELQNSCKDLLDHFPHYSQLYESVKPILTEANKKLFGEVLERYRSYEQIFKKIEDNAPTDLKRDIGNNIHLTFKNAQVFNPQTTSSHMQNLHKEKTKGDEEWTAFVDAFSKDLSLEERRDFTSYNLLLLNLERGNREIKELEVKMSSTKDAELKKQIDENKKGRKILEDALAVLEKSHPKFIEIREKSQKRVDDLLKLEMSIIPEKTEVQQAGPEQKASIPIQTPQTQEPTAKTQILSPQPKTNPEPPQRPLKIQSKTTSPPTHPGLLKISDQEWAEAKNFFEKDENKNKTKMEKKKGSTSEHSFIKIPGKNPDEYEIFAMASKSFVGESGKEEEKYATLGEGNFGKVKVVQNRKGENFAVKIEGQGLRGEKDVSFQIAKFLGFTLGEAERTLTDSLGQIITKIFKNKETSKKLYTVMQLKEGVNLRNYFYLPNVEDPWVRTNQLSPTQNLITALKVCKAVNELHKKGIIHADLKLENLMANINGQQIVVSVVDFDSAVRLEPGKSEVYDTRRGDTNYMAPELDSAMKKNVETVPYSPASDIYSLGLMFHYHMDLPEEILIGMLEDSPKDRDNMYNVMSKIINQLDIVAKNDPNALEVETKKYISDIKRELNERRKIPSPPTSAPPELPSNIPSRSSAPTEPPPELPSNIPSRSSAPTQPPPELPSNIPSRSSAPTEPPPELPPDIPLRRSPSPSESPIPTEVSPQAVVQPTPTEKIEEKTEEISPPPPSYIPLTPQEAQKEMDYKNIPEEIKNKYMHLEPPKSIDDLKSRMKYDTIDITNFNKPNEPDSAKPNFQAQGTTLFVRPTSLVDLTKNDYMGAKRVRDFSGNFVTDPRYDYAPVYFVNTVAIRTAGKNKGWIRGTDELTKKEIDADFANLYKELASGKYDKVQVPTWKDALGNRPAFMGEGGEKLSQELQTYMFLRFKELERFCNMKQFSAIPEKFRDHFKSGLPGGLKGDFDAVLKQELAIELEKMKAFNKREALAQMGYMPPEVLRNMHLSEPTNFKTLKERMHFDTIDIADYNKVDSMDKPEFKAQGTTLFVRPTGFDKIADKAYMGANEIKDSKGKPLLDPRDKSPVYDVYTAGIPTTMDRKGGLKKSDIDVGFANLYKELACGKYDKVSVPVWDEVDDEDMGRFLPFTEKGSEKLSPELKEHMIWRFKQLERFCKNQVLMYIPSEFKGAFKSGLPEGLKEDFDNELAREAKAQEEELQQVPAPTDLPPLPPHLLPPVPTQPAPAPIVVIKKKEPTPQQVEVPNQLSSSEMQRLMNEAEYSYISKEIRDKNMWLSPPVEMSDLKKRMGYTQIDITNFNKKGPKPNFKDKGTTLFVRPIGLPGIEDKKYMGGKKIKDNKNKTVLDPRYEDSPVKDVYTIGISTVGVMEAKEIDAGFADLYKEFASGKYDKVGVPMIKDRNGILRPAFLGGELSGEFQGHMLRRFQEFETFCENKLFRKIPEEFKEDFKSGLPEHLKEGFDKELQKEIQNNRHLTAPQNINDLKSRMGFTQIDITNLNKKDGAKPNFKDQGKTLFVRPTGFADLADKKYMGANVLKDAKGQTLLNEDNSPVCDVYTTDIKNVGVEKSDIDKGFATLYKELASGKYNKVGVPMLKDKMGMLKPAFMGEGSAQLSPKLQAHMLKRFEELEKFTTSKLFTNIPEEFQKAFRSGLPGTFQKDFDEELKNEREKQLVAEQVPENPVFSQIPSPSGAEEKQVSSPTQSNIAKNTWLAPPKDMNELMERMRYSGVDITNFNKKDGVKPNFKDQGTTLFVRPTGFVELADKNYMGANELKDANDDPLLDYRYASSPITDVYTVKIPTIGERKGWQMRTPELTSDDIDEGFANLYRELASGKYDKVGVPMWKNELGVSLPAFLGEAKLPPKLQSHMLNRFHQLENFCEKKNFSVIPEKFRNDFRDGLPETLKADFDIALEKALAEDLAMKERKGLKVQPLPELERLLKLRVSEDLVEKKLVEIDPEIREKNMRLSSPNDISELKNRMGYDPIDLSDSKIADADKFKNKGTTLFVKPTALIDWGDKKYMGANQILDAKNNPIIDPRDNSSVCDIYTVELPTKPSSRFRNLSENEFDAGFANIYKELASGKYDKVGVPVIKDQNGELKVFLMEAEKLENLSPKLQAHMLKRFQELQNFSQKKLFASIPEEFRKHFRSGLPADLKESFDRELTKELAPMTRGKPFLKDYPERQAESEQQAEQKEEQKEEQEDIPDRKDKPSSSF